MSVHTVTAYKNDLLQLQEYLQSKEIHDLQLLKTEHLRNWMSHLLQAGLTAKTVHRKMSSVRALIKFMRKEKLIDADPMSKIFLPKLPKKIVADIPAVDLEKMFQHFPWHEIEHGEEDKLLLLTFYTTGMRLQELTQLETNDFDNIRKTLLVTGKRNKQRLIPIHPELSDALNEHISKKENTKWLFTTKTGQQLYPMYVYRTVIHYLRLFSTAQRTSPHILRHSFATHLLNNGASLLAIKELLGHTSLAATQVYTKNSFEKLKAIHKLHPRG